MKPATLVLLALAGYLVFRDTPADKLARIRLQYERLAAKNPQMMDFATYYKMYGGG